MKKYHVRWVGEGGIGGDPIVETVEAECEHDAVWECVMVDEVEETSAVEAYMGSQQVDEPTARTHLILLALVESTDLGAEGQRETFELLRRSVSAAKFDEQLRELL